MGTIVMLLIVLFVIVGAVYLFRQRKVAAQRELDDAKAEARRWVERLGGQVYNLDGADQPAAKQALADASERYTAAGSQLEQARSASQCQLATQTAYEGLYYVRAARTAMGLDPGPELPPLRGQGQAGQVTEDRHVNVEGRDYAASPTSGQGTPYYYPGGMVAGRPVPQGWYSEPWWKPALIGGAWGVGSFLLADALFGGMHGMGGGWEHGAMGGGWDGGQSFADAGGWDGGGGQDFAGQDLAGGQDGGWDFGGGGADGGGWDFGGGGDWGGGDQGGW